MPALARNLAEAVYRATAELKGSFAIAAVMEGHDQIVVARRDSPLIIGLGDGETFIASDVPALLDYTNRIIYLENGDIGAGFVAQPQTSKIGHLDLARIDDDEFCTVLPHRFLQKQADDRVRFGGVTAGDDKGIQVLHFRDAVAHRAGADRQLQPGHTARVAQPGAVIHVVGFDDGADPLLENVVIRTMPIRRLSAPISATPPVRWSPSARGEAGYFNGNNLCGQISSVDPGEWVLITYTAKLAQTVVFGQTVNNTATFTTTSLPGDKGTGDAIPGDPGTTTGERTGVGTGANDLRGQDSTSQTILVPTMSKIILSPQSWYSIGAEGTYQITVGVPSGMTSNFVVKDELPAGLT